MYNKKVLSEATKNLDRTKAPAKKKDIITDPMGQWNHPGKDTRIPGNDITMEGVPYPVWAVPNVGAPQMMYPGMGYKFPEADYVDEFPQNEDYYEDELTDDEIAELKAGGYIVEDISVPQLTKAQKGVQTSQDEGDSLKLYNWGRNLDAYNRKVGYVTYDEDLPKHLKWKDSGAERAYKNLTLKNRAPIPQIVNYPKNFYSKLTAGYTGTALFPKPKSKIILNNKPERKPLFEIGKLPTKKLPQAQAEREIIPQTFNYTPKKQKQIQFANRSQTVMEPDPDRPGNYRMKEMRQVPYAAKFPKEGWEPANAPRVIYTDAAGNESEKRPQLNTLDLQGEIFKQGGSLLTKAQYGTATVPTQEEAQFAQRSTKGIPYADKEITLPEVTVTPAGYKGPTNLNDPLALLSPQQRTLAQGKGPVQTGKVNSYNKPLSDKQWKRQQAKDKLIRSGVAAEMYPKYFDQDLMGIQEPFELGEIMDYDADINQNAEDARYRIWKRNEERAYQNAGYGDRLLNELQSFASNPVQQVTRALTGKRSLMGQGYRDIAGEEYDDTRFYDRSKTGLEATMGATGQIFNLFNPMHYGAKAGHRINQGRYLDAAGNIAQGALTGMGAGLAKGALPLMSKVPGATGENLFKAQMLGQSMYDTPSAIGDWFDPNVSFGEAAINTGLTALGYKGTKPVFKSLGQDIKALAPVRQTIPQLSYKKGGEKKFSRSLEAKNKLFAENPFLKKKKSKKRKIFDPNAKYYQDGGAQLPEDYAQFTNFNQTLPSNLQDPEYQYGNPDQYDLYGMWNTLGKPGSFKDVQDSDYFPLQDDGTYHGFSVGSDGTLLKPMSHSTTWKEVMNSQLNTDPYFKENRLIKNEQGRLQYVPNRKKGGFQDDLGKHRQLLRDWTYGQSIGMLQEKQLGGQQYRYKGRADAVYTKDTKGNWLIKSPGTKMQWQPIDDPTGKRTTLLNKQAIPLDNTEKVGMNEAMMSKVHADRYANKIKNLRNEVNVYNNALKYEPQFDVPVSESTRVDSSLLPVSVQREKQNAALQKRTKAERIKSIEAYLKVEQQKQNQAAFDRSPAGKAAAEFQAKLDWYKRSSGRAQPADWFWTLPLAAAKAPQIATALVEANALTDIPLTIAGAARPGLTVGNAMRAYTVGTSVAGLPQAFTDLNSAKSSDEKIAATRDLVHRIIGSTPVLKWENSIYNTFSTPLTFADNTRKYFSGEELNPFTTSSNVLRTAAALTGRKEGGEMYEDEIDDETRKQLEALGYIIEDLD